VESCGAASSRHVHCGSQRLRIPTVYRAQMNSSNTGSLEALQAKIAQLGCAHAHTELLRPSCAGAIPGERREQPHEETAVRGGVPGDGAEVHPIDAQKGARSKVADQITRLDEGALNVLQKHRADGRLPALRSAPGGQSRNWPHRGWLRWPHTVSTTIVDGVVEQLPLKGVAGLQVGILSDEGLCERSTTTCSG